METVQIRLPELSGGTGAEQLTRLQSYLTYLAGELQFAFDSISREQDSAAAEIAAAVRKAENPAPAVFTNLKNLIIKSADIVERYSEEIERRLEGKYTASSEFGSFVQETRQQIRENAEGITREFSHVQQLESLVEDIQGGLEQVNAYIRTGLLYYDSGEMPVYGMEIGQQETRDGSLSFKKFVRLSADRLAFFDQNDTEIAFISDRQLHVTAAELRFARITRVQTEKIELGEYTLYLASDGHLTLN